MVAGCEIGHRLQHRNIPYPCEPFEHLHIIALRRCVRQEAITNPSSEDGNGRRSLFLIISPFARHEPTILGRSTLPTLSWTDSEPSSAAANTRRAGSWIGGPFFARSRPAWGWSACFLELPGLLASTEGPRSDATGRLARLPSLRRPPGTGSSVPSLGRLSALAWHSSQQHPLVKNGWPRLHLVTLAVGSSGRGAGDGPDPSDRWGCARTAQ
jgi:hypothetical protein